MEKFIYLFKLTAILPRKSGQNDKRTDEIKKRPRNNDAIINIQKKNNGHGGVTDPL